MRVTIYYADRKVTWLQRQAIFEYAISALAGAAFDAHAYFYIHTLFPLRSGRRKVTPFLALRAGKIPPATIPQFRSRSFHIYTTAFLHFQLTNYFGLSPMPFRSFRD